MFRWILILLVLGVLAFGAGWLANNPGSVTLDWLGYSISQSVAVMIIELVVFVAVVIVLYRLWRTFVRSPQSIKDWRKERRQRQSRARRSAGAFGRAAGDDPRDLR